MEFDEYHRVPLDLFILARLKGSKRSLSLTLYSFKGLLIGPRGSVSVLVSIVVTKSRLVFGNRTSRISGKDVIFTVFRFKRFSAALHGADQQTGTVKPSD